MVVRKTRIEFSPQDIKRVIIRCHNEECRGEFTLTSKYEMRSCPLCTTPWDRQSQEGADKDNKQLFAFHEAVRHFSSSQYKDRQDRLWSVVIELPGDLGADIRLVVIDPGL